MQTNIISVKYEDKYITKTFSGKAYSYYTAIDLEVGDFVIAPTISGNKIAKVVEINVPEYKVEKIKPYLKVIKQKIDKSIYLQTNSTLKEVA